MTDGGFEDFLHEGLAMLKTEAEAPFETASLSPATTGLPFVVFVSQRAGAPLGPQIGIGRWPRDSSARAVTVTLENPPRPCGPVDAAAFEAVTRWIELNRATLEAYWSGRIAFTEDMIGQIKSV